MYSKVVGETGVLIIGDLHISDKEVGRHINYLENCFYCLGLIRDKVEEMKPKAVVFLGDVVGVTERNIKSREVLAMLCKFFKDINKIAKVYVVRGNHDFGNYPEYQFLSDLGLFETSATCDGYFDYFGEDTQTEPEVRFHLMDYGTESKTLSIKGGDTTDIVLAHNNFTIQGLTNWYQQHDGIELSMMPNMGGVYMLISGHIHAPSPEIVSSDMSTGGSCLLFYTGCPTRPSFDKNIYESCWFVSFKYDKNEKSTNYDALDFPLKPAKDIFYTNEDFVEDKTEEDIEELERVEALKDVLDDILKCRMTSGDLLGQINAIPNATDNAKTLACNYLEAALSQPR